MRKLLACVLIASAVMAGTVVTDTVKDASGRGVNGSVTFTPSTGPFQGGSNWVAQSPVSARIVNGAFTVTLEPTPAGGCYVLTWSPARISAPQYAAIASSGTPLALAAIIGAAGCVNPTVTIQGPPVSGTYCAVSINGAVQTTGGTTWGTCPGSGSSALSLAALTDSQLAALTNSQLTALTN